MMTFRIWQFLLATAFADMAALAQQYEGNTTANTLPDVDGASIEFFQIIDSNNLTATLIVSLTASQSASANRVR